MDIINIKHEIERRFAIPLPEFYKRRIIIWYDEEGEFADQIDNLELINAKVLHLTETNNFCIKKTIDVDEPTQNFLIYTPQHRASRSISCRGSGARKPCQGWS